MRANSHPKGSILFTEQEAAGGIHLLYAGQIKLSVSSREGKTLVLKIVHPGEILGLVPMLTGTSHEATAEAIRPSQTAYVRREDFLRILAQHPAAYQGVACQMISYYRSVSDQLRTLGLALSVNSKLATFLLNWPGGAPRVRGLSRARLPLTHHEIGECIGTSRETVTRALTELKNRHLVTIRGETLSIPDRAALKTYCKTETD